MDALYWAVTHTPSAIWQHATVADDSVQPSGSAAHRRYARWVERAQLVREAQQRRRLPRQAARSQRHTVSADLRAGLVASS
ncbi:hypothetical protein GCM10009841_17810 [Microlunatus panaciterrae]|uniref:Uncharacterized protein n=1 Tax=Microlunatus panaciterrae TaxID=400768 RepID=A0ABS2RMY4_9ACTN|nr:hypothetical protein [Microlunatus panaciterrae]MBM7800340.1 hypothetical protein [Microlunatus panaciterrae]